MLDIHALMSALAVRRPVFHSEADFQHALAWEIHEQHPKVEVRLEYPPRDVRTRWHIDIWVKGDEERVAVELKYATKRLETSVGGEAFRILDQAAQDLTRYDFVKDVARIETLVEAGIVSAGHAVILSNDRPMWSGPKEGTVGRSFSCREGHVASGTAAWAAHAGPGTTRGREDPLTLHSQYLCQWREYSVVPGTYGAFRYLAIEVPGHPVVRTEREATE